MSVNTIKKTSVLSVQGIARIGILSAVAFVLMMFEFPLPIAPSFYKLDFSEVAVMMGGFAMGPAAAAVIEGIKIVLNLIFTGSITMGVGELANFLIGCALSVPAAIIYQKNKSKKTAIKGMVIGTLCMTLAGVVLNYLILLPAYVRLAHFPMEAILAAGQEIFPFISNSFIFVLACVTPFNLIKGILVSLITLLLYKHISPLLH